MKQTILKKILKNWYDPIFYRNQFLLKISSIVFKKNKGIYILNEEWDNLIILDACRYDIFKQEINKSGLKGILKKVKSRGSHTSTFLSENFSKKTYPNIVYITANPYVDKFHKGKFHKLISVWRDDWNEKYSTVLPETMYEHSIDAILKFPKKRIIIHFMQPHFPYIGYSFGAEATQRLRNSVCSEEIQKKKKNKPLNRKIFALYSVDFYRIISRKDHFELYKRNLIKTFPYLKKLINSLPGRTIITADHGESIGNMIHPLLPIRLYGHNKQFKNRVLNNVPWFIIEPEDKEPIVNQELIEKVKILKTIKKIQF
ncbi:MAG: sulfatase-like hydrolase/transferase [Promethearchaeota archaeon]